jgi:hypothetical protein
MIMLSHWNKKTWGTGKTGIESLGTIITFVIGDNNFLYYLKIKTAFKKC